MSEWKRISDYLDVDGIPHWESMTDALPVEGVGCLVRVTTLAKGHLATSVCFVPRVKLKSDVSHGNLRYTLVKEEWAND